MSRSSSISTSLASSESNSSENSSPDNPLSEDTLWPAGAFYRCDDESCGMRFPIAVGDPFRGRCPRCGAPARLVAMATPDEAEPVKARATATKGGIHLLLDNWRSLFNVGAAFRTADGAGVGHLYLCGITATPEHRKLAKTALGAEQAVAWSYHPDAVTLATTLRSAGAQLWVLERDSRAQGLFDITSLPNKSTVVLVAGNEVLGVDPGLVEIADQVIQLPMLGSKGSLNVAVALSIATYWLRAQRVSGTDGSQDVCQESSGKTS
jgi:23S rRNA (guanosine2251-2'-O)-methyltransferase